MLYFQDYDTVQASDPHCSTNCCWMDVQSSTERMDGRARLRMEMKGSGSKDEERGRAERGKGIRTARQHENRALVFVLRLHSFPAHLAPFPCTISADEEWKIFIASSFYTGNTPQNAHSVYKYWFKNIFFWLQICGIDVHWLEGCAANSLRCSEELINELWTVPVGK